MEQPDRWPSMKKQDVRECASDCHAEQTVPPAVAPVAGRSRYGQADTEHRFMSEHLASGVTSSPRHVVTTVTFVTAVQAPFTAFMSESPPSDHDFPAPGHPLPPAGSGPSQSSVLSPRLSVLRPPPSVMGAARLWPDTRAKLGVPFQAGCGKAGTPCGTLRDPAKPDLSPPPAPRRFYD